MVKNGMVKIGYALSSEEHTPDALVKYARKAEDTGFTFALISDHFHPWISQQGQSPFVWSVIGAIAHVTTTLELGTGVTCPIIRMHPAIVAHAAATAAAMMNGRFFLGVGTGENLNEHVTGAKWPPGHIRLEMLEEAVQVIRLLWQGGVQNFCGRYYTVEEARLYTLPKRPAQIMMAASGPQAVTLAARISDGMISTAPSEQLTEKFIQSGGEGKPRFGQMAVCWAQTEAKAKEIAHKWWPNGGLKHPLNTELVHPPHFEKAAEMITPADVAKEVICGPDPERHLKEIKKFKDAGYDHVYVHQVGPDQAGFFRFYEKEILPKIRY